jgi:hypothetical protein
MASTRNKNTPINYKIEHNAYLTAHTHLMYENAANGSAYDNKFAGNGLNPGNMPWNKLSSNSADIESFLFGINSTNLVNPAKPLHPELTVLSSADLFDKSPVYMPDDFEIKLNQRPLAP